MPRVARRGSVPFLFRGRAYEVEVGPCAAFRPHGFVVLSATRRELLGVMSATGRFFAQPPPRAGRALSLQRAAERAWRKFSAHGPQTRS